MADYNATMKIIRKKAPKLELSPLEQSIELLLNLGANLVDKYLDIVLKRNHKQKVPSIVKEIWEDVKKQAVKNV